MLKKNGLEGVSKLPKSLKVLLENLLRFEDNITVDKKQKSSVYSHGFSHIFYDYSNGGFRDTMYTNLIRPMLYQIMDTVKANSLLRARADMTMSTPNNYEHSVHTDYDFKNISTIYYLNKSDGDTIFFDKKIKPFKKISPKPNRLVFFNGDISHTGCSPKNFKNRILINSNYD